VDEVVDAQIPTGRDADIPPWTQGIHAQPRELLVGLQVHGVLAILDEDDLVR
jgi:hypothetical protein